MLHEESLLGLSAHNPYGSPQSTNPFDKAESHLKVPKDKDRKKETSNDRRTRDQRSKEKKKRSDDRDGNEEKEDPL